ncbi:hypothetical protein IW261DRAFT_1602358 [Armillaria novae-zelandiae]|uniref:Uncharacterized protein n=1 Tax=Armillaria novae-zelandiae TaxID=153914 RepID=A0AA39UGH4_9AGAR|nr:hypothetical protein IW261DRAFT_1602358 [Armillaria novae-zelandiae]
MSQLSAARGGHKDVRIQFRHLPSSHPTQTNALTHVGHAEFYVSVPSRAKMGTPTPKLPDGPLLNERSLLKQEQTHRGSWLRLLAFILIAALFVHHVVGDYTNMNRTDVQERTLQAKSIDLAHREEAVQAKEDAIRADEERRKRAGLIWWNLTQEKRCLGYEKRMYHAELLHLPADEDAQAWCMRTSVDIHGITYDHPERCTHEAADGTVKTIGHWTVSSNEPTCKTWWGNYQKKDCYGSHKRRVEAKMFNHQEPWDNWADMCFSTPAEFASQKFEHPDTCENKGKGGIIASWFINVDERECP